MTALSPDDRDLDRAASVYPDRMAIIPGDTGAVTASNLSESGAALFGVPMTGQPPRNEAGRPNSST